MRTKFYNSVVFFLVISQLLSSCGTAQTPGAIITPTSTVSLTPTITFTPPPAEITQTGASMLMVPTGSFMMGSDNGNADEKPPHKVAVQAFYIDKYEVTNGLYKTCLATGCTPPTGSSYTHRNYYSDSQFDNYPVIYVNWDQANAFCKWRGGRLPTEAEWEYAARGTDGRTYPWGEDTPFHHVSSNSSDTDPVGKYQSDISPFGIYDMAGNVSEWVDDIYDVYPGGDPKASSKFAAGYHIIRGGNWMFNFTPAMSTIRAASRDTNANGNGSTMIGFRCAMPAAALGPTSTPTLPAAAGAPEITQQGAVMALIPAGSFVMGSDTGEADEKPAHQVALETFYLDKFEVTNALYRACVDASGCEPLRIKTSLMHPTYYDNPRFDNYPVLFASWDEATAYCTWRGGRLPSEAEWEYAARGTDGRTYPWGEEMDVSRFNHLGPDSDPVAVGSYENGKSPFGIYDMIGNASEWVDDEYAVYPGGDPKASNSFGLRYRVVRGTSGNDGTDPRAAQRYGQNQDAPAAGFRCAASHDAHQSPFTASPPTETQTPQNTLTPRPTPSAHDIVQNGVAMAFIPAGSFTMGSDNGPENEKPAHTVAVKSFYIDKYEVTNALYQLCENDPLTDKNCSKSGETASSATHEYYADNPEFKDYPAVNISFWEAVTYCAWRGARLPTEAEWEYAARGTDGRAYPWGKDADSTRVNMAPAQDTRAVGSYENNKSPFGVYDMIGNVWEWVSDAYGPYLQKPDKTAHKEYGILRGGSWADDLNQISATTRYDASYTYTEDNTTGFRCATSDAPPPTATPIPDANGINQQGASMVRIPAGSFIMGSNSGESNAKPPHPVSLNAFYMDKYEVTNALYKACADANACTPPSDSTAPAHPGYYDNPAFANYPVIYVDWDQAQTYCAWRGGRLPSEAEWEYAALGPSSRAEDKYEYPWGSDNPVNANFYQDDPSDDLAAVGSYESGKSIFGLYDMAGNVWEWVSDWYDVYPGGDPKASSNFGQTRRGLRGSAWFGGYGGKPSTYRYADLPTSADANIGFRCAAVTDPLLTPAPKTATPTLAPHDKIQKGVIMALIPAGNFQMGGSKDDKIDNALYGMRSGYPVSLSRFYIDKYEVTNAHYKTCVDAKACSQPGETSSETRPIYYGNPQFDNYPVIYVNWDQAVTYCKWRGARLPTSAEWEYAARGTDDRTYPWGNIMDITRVNYLFKDTEAVGSHPAGQSPFGLYDMIGNVYEWVHDWFNSPAPVPNPTTALNPQGPATADARNDRIVRGGSWSGTSDAAALAGFDPAYGSSEVGFRCALTP